MTNSKNTNLIKDRDEPELRKVSSNVNVEKIGSDEIKNTISLMSKAMHGEDDGVAIAAPQIGVNKRIFIVNTKVLSEISEKAFENTNDMVFINPKLKKLSREKILMEEGCLSVRWMYGKVERSVKATVIAYDENGKKFEMGGSGLLAQIFQHEIDHLDGILFIDKAKDLEDLPPNDRK